MFEYRELEQDAIDVLKGSDVGALAAAGLMTVHGMETDILTTKIGIISLHNILYAILEKEVSNVS